MEKTIELQSIPLSQSDVHLITYALRKFYNEATYSNFRDDAKDLIEYLEKEIKK